jgi:hypothetical protein
LFVQLTLVASKILEEQDLVAKNCGYPYLYAVNNIEMLEYQNDAVPCKNVGDQLGPFGAHQLSVRRDTNKRIVMFIGQDGAFFKQLLFLTKI